MKMSYEKPTMDVEQFLANEYFAACGPTGVTYLFECDAGGGIHGDIFEDTNHSGKLDRGDKNLTQDGWLIPKDFHACGETHKAPNTDDFLDGFYVKNGGNDQIVGYKSIPVKIWTAGGTNVHATTKLNMNEWGTAKS